MTNELFVPGAKAEVLGKGRDTMTLIAIAILVVGFVVLIAFL
jgi:hypothetical protein